MKRGPVSLDHSDYVVTGVMKTPVFSVFFNTCPSPKGMVCQMSSMNSDENA